MESLPAEVFALASILALLLACGLAIVLVRALGGGKKKTRPGPPMPKTQSPPVEQPQPTNPSTESAPPVESTHGQELLSVQRTEDGDWVVLIEGKPYRRLRDIHDPRVGENAIRALQAIFAFAEGWIPFIRQWTTESIDFTQPAPQPSPTPPRPSKPPPTPTTAIPRPGSMLEPLPLIDEINDLVQQRLKEHPELTDHLITLTSTIGGGLRIYVDQQAFQAVSDITDPQVRNLIQDAIREWEGG